MKEWPKKEFRESEEATERKRRERGKRLQNGFADLATLGIGASESTLSHHAKQPADQENPLVTELLPEPIIASPESLTDSETGEGLEIIESEAQFNEDIANLPPPSTKVGIIGKSANQAETVEHQPETTEEQVKSETSEGDPIHLTTQEWKKIGRGFERLFKRLGVPFDSNTFKWKLRRKGEVDIIDAYGVPPSPLDSLEIEISNYEVLELDLSRRTILELCDKGFLEEDPTRTIAELHSCYPQVASILDSLEGMVSDEKMPELLGRADRILALANEDDLKGIEIALEFDEETLAEDIKNSEGIVGSSGILRLNLADNNERLMGFVSDRETFTKLWEAKEKHEKELKEATKETPKDSKKAKEAPKYEAIREVKALDDLRKRYNEGTEFTDVFPGTMPLETREALVTKARRAIKALPDRALRGVKFILQSGLDFPSKLIESGRIILNLDDEEETLKKFLEKAVQDRRSQRKEAVLKKSKLPSISEAIANTKTEQEKI